MIVFPLKWLPWIITIVGAFGTIAMFFIEWDWHQALWSVVLLVGGMVWLRKRKNQN